jgi:hypothetical protein
MAAPWLKYQKSPAGPWAKYQAPPTVEGGLSNMDAATPAPPLAPQPLPEKPGMIEGMGDAVRYAKDVFDTPKIAFWKGLDAVQGMTGIDSPEEVARKQAAYAEWSQRKAANRAKIKAPIITDILANPLTFVLPQQALGTTTGAKSAMGAVTGNVVSTMDPDATVDSVAAGTALGAVAPPVIQGASNLIRWAGSKATTALAGTKLGKLLGIVPIEPPSRMVENPKYAGALEFSDELDKAGITHTVGDITSDPKILSYEAALARKDPRMMDLRVKQNQEATFYADSVVKKLKDAVDSEKWTSLADVEAAAQGGKRQGEAQALLSAIQNSGDDWSRIAQSSGNLKLFVQKLKADQLYDKAGAIARLYGDVKPTNLAGSLQANINAISRNHANDQSIVPYLKGVLEDVKAGKNLSFEGMRETRSILNRKVSGLTKPNAAVQDADAARTALKNVIDALEADLDKHSKSHSSGLRKAWQEATDHYRENVVPYKDAEMGKILADQDPLALARLFKGKDKYAQERMFSLMGNKGQAATRWGLIQDAVEAGEKTQRGVTAPTMSAARVASALEKLDSSGAMGAAFKGEDKWGVQGMARLLRAVDKSDTIAWIPPTGESAERLGAEAAKGQLTALGVGEKAYYWLNQERLFRLYTNPKGRALLIRASMLNPDSGAMTRLLEQDLPKVLSVTTTPRPAPPAFSPVLAPVMAGQDTSQPFPPTAALQ